jgi:hypothetical protein
MKIQPPPSTTNLPTSGSTPPDSGRLGSGSWSERWSTFAPFLSSCLPVAV